MSGYRTGSGWNDINELMCLSALKKLMEQGFPQGMRVKLAKEIAQISGLSVGSVQAKIGNYKSVAGAGNPSNASEKTKSIFKKYDHLHSSKLSELIANERF